LAPEPTAPSSPLPPAGPEFDSFRDAIDRSSPSLSKLVPDSERSRSRSRSGSAPPPIGPATDGPPPPAQPRPPPARSGAHGGPAPTRSSEKGGSRNSRATGGGDRAPPRPPGPAGPAAAVWVAKTLAPKILVGSTELTSQYGALGKLGSATVAIDL